MMEMEENMEDPLDKQFYFFVDKVNEHFVVIDVETRLEPIWKQATNKFLSAKIDSQSELFDEALAMIDENRENIADNTLRVGNVENRVDGVEDLLSKVIKCMQDLYLKNGGHPDQLPLISLAAAGSRKRAARVQELDEDEETTVKFYTDDGYEEINSSMRALASGDIDALPREAKKRKFVLEKALRKLDNFDGMVYRGVDMPASFIEDIKKTFKENPRARVPFSDPAFMSASTKLDQSFKGKNCRFFIHSKTGKGIAQYSVHPFEYEVLFAPATNFEIHDIVIGHNKLLIRMREII